MKKADIRALYKEKRMALSPQLRRKLDDLLLIQFQKLRIDIPSLVMTYSPIKSLNEFDPQIVTDYCYFKNPSQQLFYPVMMEGKKHPELISVVVDDETVFKTNKYGIEEPVDGIAEVPLPHLSQELCQIVHDQAVLVREELRSHFGDFPPGHIRMHAVKKGGIDHGLGKGNK